MVKLFLSILILVLVSCAGITPLNKADRAKLYSADFLGTVSSITNLIDQKLLEEAQRELSKLDENELSVNEVSLKRYLLGRFYLGVEDTEKAIFNFELALSGAGEDSILISQALLGLSIGYFRLGIYDRSLDSLTKISNDHLSPIEKISSYNIGYQIAKAYQNQELYEQSLFGLVSMLGESDFKNDRYYQELFGLLNSKSLDDQKMIGLDFSAQENLPLSSYSLVIAENLIYAGRANDANEILDSLLKSKNATNFEQEVMVIREKLSDDKKVSPLKIGVILPLSGKYKKFGIEALNGIQVSYETLLKEKGFELNVKDSKSSPIISSFYAKELFEKDRVGLIIGGLSSGEAKAIYLELKNKQVPFISLAQVFIPRMEKDKFLLELPPSIESEIAELLKEDTIKQLGAKGAILFPKDEAGRLYFDELFYQQNESYTLVNAIPYTPSVKDFRVPVQNLLNLKHKKLRKDEFNLMKDFFDADESSTVRRVQILAPEIEFDWVFIASRPIEAIQLIPGFNYYDAFNTLMIGPSSWNSKKVRALGSRNKKLHFMDGNIGDDRLLEDEFELQYQRMPNLVSKRAINAVGVAGELVGSEQSLSRNEYLNKMMKSQELAFNGHKWLLSQNLWLKQMSIHYLSRGKPREGVNN